MLLLFAQFMIRLVFNMTLLDPSRPRGKKIYKGTQYRLVVDVTRRISAKYNGAMNLKLVIAFGI